MLPRSPADVPGVRCGHWTAADGSTGVTALLFTDGAVGGASLRGHASATRELAVLDPTHLAGRIHGICLAGGSAFGLQAAGGVAAVLAEQGVGFDTGHGRVPLVPAACIFDLAGASVRPGEAEGRAAALGAQAGALATGKVGAGAGARVAKGDGVGQPGGLGAAGALLDGWAVGVLVVVNAFGAIRDPETARWVAGGPSGDGLPPPGDWRGRNTTLVALATDAPLDRSGATVVADMGMAGLARATWPAFSPFDGDVGFAVSTGAGEPLGPVQLCRLGDLAAKLVAAAVVGGVRDGAQASSTTR
jgi:L-aminopeptidase/D-esterase-like protein